MQPPPFIQNQFLKTSAPQARSSRVHTSAGNDIQDQKQVLLQALLAEDTKQLTELFESGLSINDYYTFGTQKTTPLAFSIQEQKLRATRFLVGRGADFNASVIDKQGQSTTPLKIAEQISVSTKDNRLLNILLSGHAKNNKFDPKAYRTSMVEHEKRQKQSLKQESERDIFQKSVSEPVKPLQIELSSNHSTASQSTATSLSNMPLTKIPVEDTEEDAYRDPVEIVLNCLGKREPIEKYVNKYPNLLSEDTRSFVALNLKERVSDSKDAEKSKKKMAVRLRIQEKEATRDEVKTFWNQVSAQAFGKSISELFVEKPLEGFAAIAGMDHMKHELYDHVISRFRPNPNRPPGKQKTNKKPFNGLILSGLPGTGKSYTAVKLAEELGFNHMKVQLKDIQSKYHGDSGKLIDNLLKKAEKDKPCVLIFDEFDSFAPDRAAMSGEQQLIKNQVNDLLQALEDAGQRGILPIATTNYLEDMDKAITRPGRFDRSIVVPPPYFDTRVELFRMYLKQLCFGKECFTEDELHGFAGRTKGYSSKDIEELCTDADSIFENSPDMVITAAHMNMAIDQRPSSLDPEQLAKYYVEPHNLD